MYHVILQSDEIVTNSAQERKILMCRCISIYSKYPSQLEEFISGVEKPVTIRLHVGLTTIKCNIPQPH